MSQAKVAGPPWGRAPRDQSCEDVSSESGLTASAQGVSEPRVARMSQAKVAGPSLGRASRRSECRGCLRRRWPDHFKSKHLDPIVARIRAGTAPETDFGIQSGEDVPGEIAQIIINRGISKSSPPRMSHAERASSSSPPPPLPFPPPPPRLLPRCYSPACSPRRGLRTPAPARPPPPSPCV